MDNRFTSSITPAQQYLDNKRDNTPGTVVYIYEETYNYISPVLKRVMEAQNDRDTNSNLRPNEVQSRIRLGWSLFS